MKLTKLLFFCVSSLLFTVVMHAQDITVNGKVNDENGMPIPGATILIKGTSTALSSDFDGKFEVKVPSNGVLVVSFIGYATSNVEISGRTQINVKLNPESQNLNEVVVVGYGTQKKMLTTGASLSLKGKDITALKTGSAMEALQGIAPGVSITRNTGAPGAGTRVIIRGIGTAGNSNPLYIVDGIAVNDIDYLSPSDIGTITVLKDAASAAIYGSRAANGVVLVTTVKGSKDRPAKISYDYFFGVQNIYKNLDPLDAQEYMYIMDEGMVNDGKVPNDWHALLTNNTWLENYSPGAAKEYGDEIWNNLQNGWKGTNWINAMNKKDAPVVSHALNITGGSQDVTYSMGISYYDQDGILGGNITDAGYKRLTARMNTDIVLKKNSDHAILTVGENFTYTNIQNRNIASQGIYWNDVHNSLIQNPLQPVYWQQSKDRLINEFGFSPSLDGLSSFQTNPVASLYYRNNYNYGKGNNINANVYAEIVPIKNLKFKSVFGLTSWFGHNRSMDPTAHLGVLFDDSTDGATQSQYMGANSTWTNTLTYSKSVGNHNFSALVGTELIRSNLDNNIGGYKTSLLFPGDPKFAYLDNTNPAATIGDIKNNGKDGAAGGGALQSFMTRVQYDYKEKYLLSAVMRADGSSNFAPENRWGYFPSVSVGWVLTKEDFMSSTSGFLDFAKLRASWGQNGNQSIPNFIYSSQIVYSTPNAGYFFGDTKPVSQVAAYPEKVVNPDVTWETSEQLDFGLDAQLFNSKLGLTLDWYNKKTLDWLVEAPIQATFGAGAPYINGGDIQNKGFEMSVSWNDKIGDFKYGVTVSGSNNKNTVTRIANAEGIIQGPTSVFSNGSGVVSRAQVGRPIGYFYGYKTAGIIQNQNEADAYVGPDGKPYFADQRPGDIRFVDLNNDGKIDEKDKTYLGNPNPKFELGLQLNLEFKGVYLNTTLAGKFGMQVMQSYNTGSPYQNYTSDIFNRWHGEGTSNTMPRISSVTNRNSQNVTDLNMHNADYLRINNFTLGYNFNEILANVKFISNLKMYMAVNNLYTFTKYNGMDPEVRFSGDGDSKYNWASGIDLGLYPQARTVMFGMSADF